MPARRLGMKSGASGRAIDFHHAAIGHKENADGKDIHGEAHNKGLEPQPQKSAHAHSLQLAFKVWYQGVKINGCLPDNHTGALIDDALGGVEYAHDDVPCVRYDQDCKRGFEYPAEEHGAVKVVHIVLFRYHLDKLIAHDKGEYGPGYGDDHGFRQAVQHIENTAVPCLRGSSHVGGDFSDFGIYRIEQPGQVARDTVHEDAFYPFFNDFTNHG